MTEPLTLTPEQKQHAQSAALELGRLVAGRDLTVDEAEAMTVIFTAAAQALQHGHAFIQRLAEKVRLERETESVEEFFEDMIQP